MSLNIIIDGGNNTRGLSRFFGIIGPAKTLFRLKMKLSIIVPVYNEAATVRTVLDQLEAFLMEGLEKEVIVVEGGSADGSRAAVKEYESRPGFRAVYEERPRGKGAAVRAGLGLVTGDIVLIQDADLEYSVSDYPKVLLPIMEGRASIVFGSRALTHRQKWQYRRFHGLEKIYGFFVNFGGLLYTSLFNLLYGTSLSDGATMFKVFRAELLKSITLKSDGFDFDWEIQAKMARRGMAFFEVPVSYTARSRAEGKKICFWKDGLKVLRAIIKFRFTD